MEIATYKFLDKGVATKGLKVIACTPTQIQKWDHEDCIKIVLRTLEHGSREKQLGAGAFLAAFLKTIDQEAKEQTTQACAASFVGLLVDSKHRDLGDRLVVYITNGLARVWSRDQPHGHLAERSRVFSPENLSRMLKFLHNTTKEDEDLKVDVAETMFLLASQSHLDAVLNEIDGLRHLVDLAELGGSMASTYAAFTLIHLSEMPQNHQVLTKIVAIKAIAPALTSGDDEWVLPAIEMVKNLPWQWRALHNAAKEATIKWCVDGLESPTAARELLSFTVLTSIHASLTGALPTPVSDANDEKDEEDKEVEGKIDGSEDQEEQNRFVERVKELGGTESLIGILRLFWQQQSKRLEEGRRQLLLNLLRSLAIADAKSANRIGSCMSDVVTILREGDSDERLAAAKLLMTLVWQSTSNAADAVEAGIVYPFVRLLTTHSEADDLVWNFLCTLHRVQAPEATEAILTMTRLLAELAAEHGEDRASAAAFQILTDYLTRFGGDQDSVDAVSVIQMCTNVLSDAWRASPPVYSKRVLRVLEILSRLSQNIHSRSFPRELVNLLVDHLQNPSSSADDTRVNIAKTLSGLARSDAFYGGKILTSTAALVEIIEYGEDEERVAVAEAVVSLAQVSQQNALHVLNAGIVNALVAWWDSTIDVDAVAECTIDLLYQLDAQKIPQTIAAVNDLIGTVVAVAVDDDNALNIFWEYEIFESFETMDGAVASDICVAVLKGSYLKTGNPALKIGLASEHTE